MAFSIAYRPTFVIVDGMNFFIRSYVVNPTMDVNGTPCGGVVGTLSGIRKLAEQYKPTALFVIWDGEGGSERRRSIRSEYKEGRKVRLNREYEFGTDAKQELGNLDDQIKTTMKYLSNLGIGQIKAAGVEADDMIAYTMGLIDGHKTIVTADRDMFQLVCDTVSVYNPIKKKTFDKKGVVEDVGCLPSNYACMKAICGDKGDNVSGVDGIGPKSLMKMVPEMATIECMGLNTILDIIDSKKVDGKKINKKAEKISSMREHINENMLLVSLSSPMVSTDAARHARSIINDKKEFKALSVRSDLIKDGIQLHEEFDRQFITLSSRTALWLKDRKNKDGE